VEVVWYYVERGQDKGMDLAGIRALREGAEWRRGENLA
jgi:hypothetical protein